MIQSIPFAARLTPNPLPRNAPFVDRRPDGSIPLPRGPVVTFNAVYVEHTDVIEVNGVYLVTDGPTFTAAYSMARSECLASEWRRADFDCGCHVLADIIRQVDDYNAVVLPVPNGPDDLVAFAEAKTRLLMASHHLDGDALAGQPNDFRAALKAVASLPLPTTQRSDHAPHQ